MFVYFLASLGNAYLESLVERMPKLHKLKQLIIKKNMADEFYGTVHQYICLEFSKRVKMSS